MQKYKRNYFSLVLLFLFQYLSFCFLDLLDQTSSFIIFDFLYHNWDIIKLNNPQDHTLFWIQVFSVFSTKLKDLKMQLSLSSTNLLNKPLFMS